MRNIEKGREPDSLRAHRSTPGADWDGYKGKKEAFAALCHEQGYLCAYCLCRLKPGQEPRKIEHWIAQKHLPGSPHAPSVHRDHEMKWSNLLGVCPGDCGPQPPARKKSAPPRARLHCDSYRGNRPLNIHPAQETRPLDELFKYRSNGVLWSNDKRAAQDIATLNLNVWRLKGNRYKVLEELRKALPLPPRRWNESLLRKELAKWQQRTSPISYQDEEHASHTVMGFRPFNQVAINFLEKQLRKRRVAR